MNSNEDELMETYKSIQSHIELLLCSGTDPHMITAALVALVVQTSRAIKLPDKCVLENIAEAQDRLPRP